MSKSVTGQEEWAASAEELKAKETKKKAAEQIKTFVEKHLKLKETK